MVRGSRPRIHGVLRQGLSHLLLMGSLKRNVESFFEDGSVNSHLQFRGTSYAREKPGPSLEAPGNTQVRHKPPLLHQ